MTEPKKAEFRVRDSNRPIKVHFNPSTLQITYTTRLSQSRDRRQGRGQVVNEASAKLSVDLVFDTTDTLENVCDKTVEVARLLGEKDQPPPQVTFDWGAFSFVGIVDSYKETLEFFSVDGVPLRSAVTVTMTKDEDIYARGAAGQRAAGWSPSNGPASEGAAQVTAPPPGSSVTTTATQAGAPAAGRAIAAQNGEESMRFPSAPTLTVSGSVSLSPPSAFTSASVSLGATGSVAQGAFSGLRVPSPSASANLRLDPRRLIQRVETFSYAADEGASFELGGRMKTRGPRLGGTGRARIRFEEE